MTLFALAADGPAPGAYASAATTRNARSRDAHACPAGPRGHTVSDPCHKAPP